MSNIHEQIKSLLSNDKIVYSFALGRVGQIMSVEDHPSGFVVEICSYSRTSNTVKRHRHVHGATTFVVGDAVKLEKRNDAANNEMWVVINEGL